MPKCKVDSVYANDDPYIARRWWVWNPTWQLLFVVLVLVGTIGAVVGTVGGWIFIAWMWR